MKINKANVSKENQIHLKNNFDVRVAVHGDQKGITLIALVITIVLNTFCVVVVNK